MPRRILVCGEMLDADDLKPMYMYIQKNNCILERPPLTGWNFYRNLEDTIDRCDVFVAVLDDTFSGTWDGHAFEYATRLNKHRFSPRPRVFIYNRNKEGSLNKWLKKYDVEMMDNEKDYQKLLEDLPERG